MAFTAATAGAETNASLTLIDLANGRRTGLAVPLGDVNQSTLAWSPDSRFLFVVDATGQLRVIDPVTADSLSPGWQTPALKQIGIRTAPTSK